MQIDVAWVGDMSKNIIILICNMICIDQQLHIYFVSSISIQLRFTLILLLFIHLSYPMWCYGFDSLMLDRHKTWSMIDLQKYSCIALWNMVVLRSNYILSVGECHRELH